MEANILDFADGLSVPMTIFEQEFLKFCRTRNLQMPRGMNEDYYNSIFQGRNIQVIDPEGGSQEYDGELYYGKFCVNVDIKPSVRQQNAGGGGGYKPGGYGYHQMPAQRPRTSPIPGAQNAAH